MGEPLKSGHAGVSEMQADNLSLTDFHRICQIFDDVWVFEQGTRHLNCK